jgi:hypothetical protein
MLLLPDFKAWGLYGEGKEPDLGLLMMSCADGSWPLCVAAPLLQLPPISNVPIFQLNIVSPLGYSPRLFPRQELLRNGSARTVCPWHPRFPALWNDKLPPEAKGASTRNKGYRREGGREGGRGGRGGKVRGPQRNRTNVARQGGRFTCWTDGRWQVMEVRTVLNGFSV